MTKTRTISKTRRRQIPVQAEIESELEDEESVQQDDKDQDTEDVEVVEEAVEDDDPNEVEEPEEQIDEQQEQTQGRTTRYGRRTVRQPTTFEPRMTGRYHEIVHLQKNEETIVEEYCSTMAQIAVNFVQVYRQRDKAIQTSM